MKKALLYVFLLVGLGFLTYGIIRTNFFFKEKSPSIAPQATIFMTKSGFSPQEVSIKKGQRIEFINSESKNCPISDVACSFWPASDPHPTHVLYSEFDSRRQLGPGESWSFTFDKVGTWGFHNHFKPEVHGVIHVVE